MATTPTPRSRLTPKERALNAEYWACWTIALLIGLARDEIDKWRIRHQRKPATRPSR